MDVKLAEEFQDTEVGDIATNVIKKCVHCGFCNATCPTYLLTGDELDGPRGRIYQMKLVFEGEGANSQIQHHLDRCLTCLNCETTCPSGVEYHQLLNVGRKVVEDNVKRGILELSFRESVRFALTRTQLFALMLRLGQIIKPILPRQLSKSIPNKVYSETVKAKANTRKMLLLAGCLQSKATPATNNAAIGVFNRLGIELIEINGDSCCGAINFHLNKQDEAKQQIRRYIDAIWPLINQQSVEAIVSTASGCGLMIKDYACVFTDEADYGEKAKMIANKTKDIAEIIAEEDLLPFENANNSNNCIAFHCPCTFQHGKKLSGMVESILTKLGFELLDVNDSHLCCGSAGTYSILQPKLAKKLLTNKIDNLIQEQPSVIATANIGCQLHLQTATSTPVVHWIELIANNMIENQ